MKRVRLAVNKGDLILIGDEVEFQLAEDGVDTATMLIEIPDGITVKRRRPIIKHIVRNAGVKRAGAKTG